MAMSLPPKAPDSSSHGASAHSVAGDPPLVHLTHALALGQVTLGEMAGITLAELDALYEMGARRLEADRDQEAQALFAALVTLFPYCDRYWRAYAIALERCAAYPAAINSYHNAQVLAPDDEVARAGLERCARWLEQTQQGRSDTGTPSEPLPKPQGFALSDGRPLPLAAPPTQAQISLEHDTPRPAQQARVEEPTLTHATGYCPNRLSSGAAAIAADAGDSAWQRQEPTQSARPNREVTMTAIVRRRQQMPLGDEDTLTFMSEKLKGTGPNG